MSNCFLCDYELFKHAAIAITYQQNPQDGKTEKLTTRLFRRLRPSKKKQILNLHPYCAEIAPQLLQSAMAVQRPLKIAIAHPNAATTAATQNTAAHYQVSSKIKTSQTFSKPALPNQADCDRPKEDTVWEIEPHIHPPLEQQLQNTSSNLYTDLTLLKAYQDGERSFMRISLVKSDLSKQTLQGHQPSAR
ncbi:MAG: hypothetical protein HC810_08125 [Acaryochloridaceae cyanobacterium RL_2_7]|nr:hypothetical protein [Acaryochloridaceae cyanobacterium RL_2_7]